MKQLSVNKNETPKGLVPNTPKYPGIPVTCNGNKLVTQWVEVRITEGGVYYPITPSTEGGEIYQQAFSEGVLDVWGNQKLSVEAEGEHAAQGGAIAVSMTGKRTVNFTSGQGIVYAMEQYYHAPAKFSTMVLEVGARALTKHALNVHCGHDDFNAALDTGWTMLMARDAQQAADQAIILRKCNEITLNPGMNIQDGMLTTHSERTYRAPEADLLREYLGAPDEQIDTPTKAQKELFGPRRRRVPKMLDLKNPVLLGPVQNQEHYMNGVIARRDNFNEPILKVLKECYEEFAQLTGRKYGLIHEYKTEDADTVFISLGSATDNIEAACDYMRKERNAKVGSIHINVIRPFPEAEVINALRGKKRVLILERTDEGMAGDNPLGRDIRTALSKAQESDSYGSYLPALKYEEVPRIFRASYGLGSRDFRPEHIIGAYEYAIGDNSRKDGRSAKDGENYFTLGINHPYSVISSDTPSLLPKGAIAVRFHSIGGWGMITTGKNLGEIIGKFGQIISNRKPTYNKLGQLEEKLFIMANPKYGSEKKGAPTNYFLTVASKKIQVNCELNHVDVVLCCDPKAFTHTNPLEGLKKGGSLVWESSENPDSAWERIPSKHRDFIKKNKIRVFILPGFSIAREATKRADLQLRMQGNTFLGAFFKVSTFLQDHNINEDEYRKIVHNQYEKKFGRFGSAVVDSNMKVMDGGFNRVQEIKYGDIEDEDTSSMRNPLLAPKSAGLIQIPATAGCEESGCKMCSTPEGQTRSPFQTIKKFDSEFRNGFGYHQPSGAYASLSVMAAASGATQSKYVARRETPVFIAENCTQCMECITACPDTAMPNSAQDIRTILSTAIRNYISKKSMADALHKELPLLDENCRKQMNENIVKKIKMPFSKILELELNKLDHIDQDARSELLMIISKLPLAYNNVNAIYRTLEKKSPGQGGLFSIFISDLCKGCGECVQVCGDHNALKMEQETPGLNSKLSTAQLFSRLLPETNQKFLGLYQTENPEEARESILRNHLMVRRNYEALVSGDGACAGCGEKTVLRAVASITEAYMRPIFHRKAKRLNQKAQYLKEIGLDKLEAFESKHNDEYNWFKRSLAHIVLGLGGENENDTNHRLKNHGLISNQAMIDALVTVIKQDAFNHSDLQAIDGSTANGMSTMYMGAHTGCNTVYGSTPPSNPHPYPWMNSLFQDGSTISWLIGEAAILNHSRRSVTPERLATALLERETGLSSEQEYFELTHLDDSLMTDLEISELPKVWAIGGDGAMGDIGFQNVSKVVLQNRPNVNLLMLDTQVYSNTGGQNSDSSNMLGGYDMNQFGVATQGKLNEKKSVAEAFTSGHGSPFVAQVSMANSAKMYKAMIDGLEYRGTSFFQCFTSCQPEHGVGDNMSANQARMVRDSRGMPEFIYNPRNGEILQESFNLKANPSLKKDWFETKFPVSRESYNMTVAHWAITEARFRRHINEISDIEANELIHIENILTLVTQQDVIYRRVFDQKHHAYIPDWGVYFKAEVKGILKYFSVSRQMVLFHIERRKSWRMLQSRAGITNEDYAAQKLLLEKLKDGEISRDDCIKEGKEILKSLIK
ncbi:2-oxoacid:acceptor oxidoreductase family protein [Prochlorococcus sp. MIT 1307]|uniref:2-oxoacid:acceptor oxidoreductase family protein n=1 Tax=Prochlorococcus sp. MIT 1307 TaxID=3096219 RepID=UPI002A7566C7|nr:2-oxoacid:acceptor oxidoreductase family protein [Prochlorococcus sp. MIT 1307]